MVAVEVRDDDRINGGWVDVRPPQADETARSTVNQTTPAVIVHEDACLQTSPAAEGVAATNELDRGHTRSLSRGMTPFGPNSRRHRSRSAA